MTYDHENYWAQIKPLAEDGKIQELQHLIESVPDLNERTALFRFTVRALMFRDWQNKNLEPLIQLGDSGIATALENFKQHPEDLSLKDEANIICYNMSSNLAGCWNDGFIRTPAHFRKGLEYAERALAFRRELKKGPRPFSIAYWAKGIHEFFLGDIAAAEKSFQESLRHAESPFDTWLQRGYIALTQLAQNNPHARSEYDKVIAAFEEMKSVSDDAREDAEIGISQLQNTLSSIGKN